jgi:hypothetical protein
MGWGRKEIGMPKKDGMPKGWEEKVYTKEGW